MTTYIIQTKTKKGKWTKEKGKYKSYDAVYKAALYYKRKGRKAKIMTLKGRTVTSNTMLTVNKYNPFKFLDD